MRNLRATAMTFLSAAVTALLLTSCAESTGASGQSSQAPAGDGPIRIGAVLDITGAGAALGVAERKTLEMLAEETNADGGINGREVELIVEDNQSTEAAAATAITKLINEDNVDIVIGASRTGPSLAMRPIAESAQVPMISLAANADIIDGSEWVFKTTHSDRLVLERMVEEIDARGWETIGLALDASGFGEGVEAYIQELAAPRGIEVVASEKFAPDATDFTAQMVNLRQAGADVNIIWGIPPAAALAQQAYRRLGLEAPVMHSFGIGSQVFLDTAGPSAEGVLAALPKLLVVEQLPEDDPSKEVIMEFIAQYSAAYDGEKPNNFAGIAFDAYKIATAGLEEVGTDKAALRDYIENVEGLHGVNGTFNITPQDHAGLAKEDLQLVTVEGGTWKLAEG